MNQDFRIITLDFCIFLNQDILGSGMTIINIDRPCCKIDRPGWPSPILADRHTTKQFMSPISSLIRGRDNVHSG